MKERYLSPFVECKACSGMGGYEDDDPYLPCRPYDTPCSSCEGRGYHVRRLTVEAWEAEAGREYRGPVWRWYRDSPGFLGELPEPEWHLDEYEKRMKGPLIAWPGFGPPDEDPAWEPEGGQDVS
jgi:hypothetical protein